MHRERKTELVLYTHTHTHAHAHAQYVFSGLVLIPFRPFLPNLLELFDKLIQFLIHSFVLDLIEATLKQCHLYVSLVFHEYCIPTAVTR